MRLGLVWMAVILAACSPAPLPATTAPSMPTAVLSPETVMAEFVECMRRFGVEVETLRVDTGGRPVLDDLSEHIDDPGFAEAVSRCAVGVVDAGLLDLSSDPELQEAVVEVLGRYAECMRALGLVSFPDPDPGFDGVSPAFPIDEVPFAHPEYEIASSMCRSVVADGG